MVFALSGYILSNAVYLINWFFFYELRAEFLLFEVKISSSNVHRGQKFQNQTRSSLSHEGG